MKHSLALAILALGLGLGTTTVLAQDNGNNGGPGSGRRGGFGSMDPAQRQQWMLERIKDRLEIKDDAEWSALQPRVQKVMEIQQQILSDRMHGMFGGRNRGGDSAQGDQGQRRGPFGGQASPESEALQRAIDAKASKTEIKAALEKYVAARKARQADLEKAQENLRQVLTSRQEAIATISGLL